MDTRLYCLVDGCRKRTHIRGMTGLQELENLRKHLAKAHQMRLDMSQALEVREKFERGETIPDPRRN